MMSNSKNNLFNNNLFDYVRLTVLITILLLNHTLFGDAFAQFQVNEVPEQKTVNTKQSVMPSDNVPKQNSENELLSLSDVVNILGVVIPIILTITLFWHKEKSDQREIMRRAIGTLLQELDGTVKALIGNPRYTLGKRLSADTEKGLEFTNEFLITDAYDSVLHSGLFTHFSGHTQYKLTQLYGRVKGHNEYVKYLDKYRDMFFLYDKTESRHSRWKHEKNEYASTLGSWEGGIVRLVGESEKSIKRDLFLILHGTNARFKSLLKLRGNQNYNPKYGG
jgi:hypothetical protein